MRTISVDDIPRLVEDTVYTAVGLGVLGFQRIQVQRQELKRSVAGTLDGAREALDQRVRLVEERLTDLDDRVDELYRTVEPKLPGPARQPARLAMTLAREVRGQVFDLVERGGRPTR